MYWADKVVSLSTEEEEQQEDVYNHMRNKLHKSQAGCHVRHLWLTYGHSLAGEKEHDQVMAAYLKASQLMEGCHLPQIYIGLEYSLTNNTHLAEKFFSQALEVAPNHPPE